MYEIERPPITLLTRLYFQWMRTYIANRKYNIFRTHTIHGNELRMQLILYEINFHNIFCWIPQHCNRVYLHACRLSANAIIVQPCLLIFFNAFTKQTKTISENV